MLQRVVTIQTVQVSGQTLCWKELPMHHQLPLTVLAVAAMLSTHVSVSVAQGSVATLVGAVIDSATRMPIVDVTVYASAAQVPEEFNQTGAGCGVIVVWTR